MREQKDFEVYSCHVSPDGKRLATAGGVRFSPNGRYLASGADDKIICIYQLESGPPTIATFGTNEPPPVENWKTSKRLVGHDNDVQDLAWSYDGSILVSVGLDSKIVIWSGHTFEKLKVLSVHQSHVKGITFDPANKFFATASDDRTIKIFRFTSPAPNATQHDMVNNFVLETTINTPFKSSPLTTYFRRCSWSPDGNHIAAANAVNGPVSSVAIIERSRWDSEINLIGHEGPTEVCMFSPRLFHTKKPLENGATNGHSSGGALVTVIASAGQDKTLSVWNTNTSRPVVILQDLAAKSISDLAWTPDGQTLFASSLDGGIVCCKFETGELGWVANLEETDKALSKYGSARKAMGIAEDVDGLQLENHSKEGERKGAESRMGALMGDFHPLPKDGTPATNGAKTGTATPNQASTNGQVEAEAEKDKSTPAPEPADKTAERVTELKSRVTITKDEEASKVPENVILEAKNPVSVRDPSHITATKRAVGPTAPKETKNDQAAVSAGIIPYLERHTTNEFLLKGRAYTLQRLIKTLLSKDGFESFESTVSIAHLENRIAGALSLGSKDEFRLYLLMYAKRIGAEGLRGKVEELLNLLLGGVLQDKKGEGDNEGTGWFSQDEIICGWDRKELLKGVVMILGKFRELQRLTVQYARILDLTLEDDEGGDAMAIES
ncbi:hir1 protein [Eutypa lata UCREL1]|uniref:Hir1 protein n=1 Tax=Eutypa lata (strain UCR-EL1) TaxID=1287681 RepID=M7SSV3_EUTLA|nr:hir1 protein [Eutypa lata UCREL1]